MPNFKHLLSKLEYTVNQRHTGESTSMLQLHNITKRYEAGEFSVDALKGVSLNFRTSEFVSILGPSGCGKTTMLNIIGGLDRYTDGDLVINGKSTKNFNDRDWDAYRNHSIGFVFQSYNLIPHQTVLQNVELALALSGVKKAERVTRAKQALDQVGLKNMYHKRPSEMSGGQMQRVAIARAIVNNPDIILADEPTGALDTETSVQVMEILKEISKDRLVVMVTHNPELAEKYSTRIVRMLDGLLVDDSKPLSEKELQQEIEADQAAMELAATEKADKKRKKEKKPKMSFWTSFALSIKNLFTKRGRTMLTSFAGSIGIIGIALIFAVSQGTTNYIAAVQEDTLAAYPLTIEQTNINMTSMFASFVNAASSETPGEDLDLDAKQVYEKLALYNLAKSIQSIDTAENDLKAFKSYIDEQLKDPDSDFSKALNGIQYTYNVNLAVYTKDVDGKIIESSISKLMREMVEIIRDSEVEGLQANIMQMLLSASSMMTSMWQELLPASDGGLNDIVKSQYDIVEGRWPAAANEVVLVVDENNQIDDMTAYALGWKSFDEVKNVILSAITGEEYKPTTHTWSFAELMDKQYRTIFDFEFYQQNAKGVWTDMRDDDSLTAIGADAVEMLYNDSAKGMSLKVVGIIRPNLAASAHMLSGSICYTTDLTKEIITRAHNSEIAKAQKDNPNVDIFTGNRFKNTLTEADKAQEFRNIVQNADTMQKVTYFYQMRSVPTPQEVAAAAKDLQSMDEATLKATLCQMLEMVTTDKAELEQNKATINSLDYETLQSVTKNFSSQYAQFVKYQAVTQEFPVTSMEDIQRICTQLDEDVVGYTDSRCAEFFDTLSTSEFSDATYEENLAKLGCLDLDTPFQISLYAVSFAAKDKIADAIQAYNDSVENDSQKIEYTDYVGLIMSSVTTIISAITYVLIGFVSISLIVSSIMIGVITLISVQERTKEIGILRAIGASKRNVSGMFNAETVIVGFISGLLGVLVTYLLSIIVNVILHAATGIMSLNAVLPVWTALALIGISMLLTLIAGIIPSRSAAKKDPVVALRTE